MLGWLRGVRERRRLLQIEQQLAEDAFLERCREVVERRAEALHDSGLAHIVIDPDGGGGPPSISMLPTASGAAEVWIGLDYPTFCLTFPDPVHRDGFSATAELFGSHEERLVELVERLDAIIAGRLEWQYNAESRCLAIRWLRADGEPFLETHYVGGSQATANVSGRSAPYAS